MKARIELNEASKRYRGNAPQGQRFHLNPVSLEVNGGEVLGCIGSNGSGKSTMLKLVAGITHPSSGTVSCTGRVRAMLELGAGLHHDLTGVENIFLLASIHGYSRKATKAVLEQIQEFSGLSNSRLNAKIKTYSTGMNLRLAFSTVVHLHAEILLLDEVFAVGDMKFQERCIQRLKELKQRGAAMMIAGHNLEIIEEISDQLIWIEHGTNQFLGDPKEGVARYRLFNRESTQ